MLCRSRFAASEERAVGDGGESCAPAEAPAHCLPEALAKSAAEARPWPIRAAILHAHRQCLWLAVRVEGADLRLKLADLGDHPEPALLILRGKLRTLAGRGRPSPAARRICIRSAKNSSCSFLKSASCFSSRTRISGAIVFEIVFTPAPVGRSMSEDGCRFWMPCGVP